MKVAINRCYGGFNLSDKAIEMIMRRKGLNCYRYKQTKYSFQDGKNEYTKISASDVQKNDIMLHYSATDLGDTIETIPKGGFWYYGNLDRTDEDMIGVIEEIGSEADGICGEIKIVEIPDGVEWEVDNYDGMESIHEAHSVWY